MQGYIFLKSIETCLLTMARMILIFDIVDHSLVSFAGTNIESIAKVGPEPTPAFHRRPRSYGGQVGHHSDGGDLKGYAKRGVGPRMAEEDFCK